MNRFYSNCFSHRIDILEIVTYRSNLLHVKFIFSRDSELKPRDWILLLDFIVFVCNARTTFQVLCTAFSASSISECACRHVLFHLCKRGSC